MFSGKVVLVTGASSGIGAATALEFSRQGASVVLVARSEEKLQSVYNDCKSAGSGDHLTVIADLRDSSHVESVITKTIAKYQRLDVLVNNAGSGRYGFLKDFPMDDFDWVLNLNLRSVVQLTKLALPHLIESKGNIVNVSSIAGINGIPGASVYCMSKAALDMFTRCTALEVAGSGVRVNSVNPAVIVTEFHKSMGMTEQEYAAYLDHCRNIYPLKRVGTPEEVADAILYLAGDKAGFLTGVLLPISGGKHIDYAR